MCVCCIISLENDKEEFSLTTLPWIWCYIKARFLSLTFNDLKVPATIAPKLVNISKVKNKALKLKIRRKKPLSLIIQMDKVLQVTKEDHGLHSSASVDASSAISGAKKSQT